MTGVSLAAQHHIKREHQMVDINVDPKLPFKIGNTPISRINIAAINFAMYTECFNDRMRESARGGNEIMAEKAFRRSRRMKQVTAYDKNNVLVPLTHEAFGSMPRPLFVRINNLLDNE